jgi:hypothetical protein
MRRRFFVAALAACAPSFVLAQSGAAQVPPGADCTQGEAELASSALLGFWRAEFEGMAAATLLLEQSRDYAQGLSGAIHRDSGNALLAGDLDDGAFTLEESYDGSRISATWDGSIVPGSCGREIRGDWNDTQSGQVRAFVLRRAQR